MNEKPAQPDPLAANSPRQCQPAPGEGHAVLTGPVQFGPDRIGLFLGSEDAERLLALIQYAAERLDSGKVSPELKASERIIRRLLPILERDVVGPNRRRDAEFEAWRRGEKGEAERAARESGNSDSV